MKGINQNVKLAIEILTPVQAGSGAELFKDLDYIDRAGTAFVVDQIQSFNAIADSTVELSNALLSGANLSDLVSAAGQDYGYRIPWLSGKPKLPEKFREHIKDAMNRPYLPGSAIKGAIRTAIIAEYLRAIPATDYQHLLPSFNDRQSKKNWASKKLLELITGKDAKNDIFRPFKVKDALFANCDLRLADVRWLNEKRWRSMSTKQSLENWQEADGVTAEVLQPQALAELNLQWDGFLLSGDKWHPQGIPSLLPKTFSELADKLNNHAKYRLNSELKYYTAQGKQQPLQECQKLLKQLEEDNSEAAYLQLCWGSGWRGMTGDWATSEQISLFRELYSLGKKGNPLFPKTRRLIVSGEPKLPMGWIRLIPYASVAEKLEQQQIVLQSKAAQSGWVTQKLAEIAQLNRCSERDALRGKGLAEAWQTLADGAEKSAALADIKLRWQAENWWDAPNGKSAKQAKTIYEQSN